MTRYDSGELQFSLAVTSTYTVTPQIRNSRCHIILCCRSESSHYRYLGMHLHRVSCCKYGYPSACGTRNWNGVFYLRPQNISIPEPPPDALPCAYLDIGDDKPERVNQIQTRQAQVVGQLCAPQNCRTTTPLHSKKQGSRKHRSTTSRDACS